jgi:hypothetical protein
MEKVCEKKVAWKVYRRLPTDATQYIYIRAFIVPRASIFGTQY